MGHWKDKMDKKIKEKPNLSSTGLSLTGAAGYCEAWTRYPGEGQRSGGVPKAGGRGPLVPSGYPGPEPGRADPRLVPSGYSGGTRAAAGAKGESERADRRGLVSPSWQTVAAAGRQQQQQEDYSSSRARREGAVRGGGKRRQGHHEEEDFYSFLQIRVWRFELGFGFSNLEFVNSRWRSWREDLQPRQEDEEIYHYYKEVTKSNKRVASGSRCILAFFSFPLVPVSWQIVLVFSIVSLFSRSCQNFLSFSRSSRSPGGTLVQKSLFS